MQHSFPSFPVFTVVTSKFDHYFFIKLQPSLIETKLSQFGSPYATCDYFIATQQDQRWKVQHGNRTVPQLLFNNKSMAMFQVFFKRTVCFIESVAIKQ